MRLYSRREGYILGGSHNYSIRCSKRGYILGGTGIFWEGHIYLFKRGYILGQKGRFWDKKTLHISRKGGGR